MALAFTADSFEQDVLKSEIPCLVDFTATWCGPCQQLAPVVQKLAEKYKGKVKIGKVDIDSEPDLTSQYGVTSVPTVIFFKNGEVVDTVRGYNPETFFAQKLDGLIG